MIRRRSIAYRIAWAVVVRSTMFGVAEYVCLTAIYAVVAIRIIVIIGGSSRHTCSPYRPNADLFICLYGFCFVFLFFFFESIWYCDAPTL